jgi:hypothetical protein
LAERVQAAPDSLRAHCYDPSRLPDSWLHHDLLAGIGSWVLKPSLSPPINALAKTKIRFALMLFKDDLRTNEAIDLLMSAKNIYINNKSGKDVAIVQGIINQHKKE